MNTSAGTRHWLQHKYAEYADVPAYAVSAHDEQTHPVGTYHGDVTTTMAT